MQYSCDFGFGSGAVVPATLVSSSKLSCSTPTINSATWTAMQGNTSAVTLGAYLTSVSLLQGGKYITSSAPQTFAIYGKLLDLIFKALNLPFIGRLSYSIQALWWMRRCRWLHFLRVQVLLWLGCHSVSVLWWKLHGLVRHLSQHCLVDPTQHATRRLERYISGT